MRMKILLFLSLQLDIGGFRISLRFYVWDGRGLGAGIASDFASCERLERARRLGYLHSCAWMVRGLPSSLMYSEIPCEDE